MTKIAMITEDTKVVLPEMNHWKGTIGRGTCIVDNQAVKISLQNSKMPIPSTDIEFESQYRHVLSRFVRPAKLMFGGLFGEVRAFHTELQNQREADLYVISGRYGLINDQKEIIPYWAPISRVEDIAELESRTHFSRKMLQLAKDCILVLVLPSYFIRFLLQSGWFGKAVNHMPILVVCSKKLEPQLARFQNTHMIGRRGIARIGKHNQATISKLATSLDTRRPQIDLCGTTTE